ncbi:unnamed protein product [Cyprideis torosa]|uniref:Uncharacterized protein n=1 Tax=Cyprideis torosa TaxID=163714 RepID=A0A7R8WJ98_9CRUS|nr:unnamed protein product [Cyprideis torosa]CAG0899810.1 unnamed protein product [Cyprideis torosa]
MFSEGDMPLEELLRSYGYQPIGDEASQSSSSEEILSNHDLTLDREVIARDLLGEITGGSPDQDSDTSDYILHPYKVSVNVALRNWNRSTLVSQEAEYGTCVFIEQSVRVGEDHQASIPALEPYESDALPYDNPDFLMWSPYATDFSEKETEDYLNEIQTLASASSSVKSGGQSQQIPSTPPSSSISNWLPSHKAALPAATYVKDNEAALLLLQQCGNDKSEALRRWKLQSASGGVASPLNTDWSETECEAFEQGLRQFGKNFSQIQRHQVKTRSVGELVYFYYQWKKTLRHDAYMAGNRLEKKRYFLNPNITDLMERYITEGQFLFDSVSTSSSSTLPGYSNHHHHHHHYHHFHASTTTSVMTSFCSSNGEAATDGPSSDVTTTASHPSSYPRATSPVSSIFSLIHSDSRRRTPPIPTSPSYNSHHHSHSHHSTSSFFSPIQAPSTAQESAHHVQVRVPEWMGTFSLQLFSICSQFVRYGLWSHLSLRHPLKYLVSVSSELSCLVCAPAHETDNLESIIGGGIGGTAAAYFLKQEFAGSGGVKVDLYEKNQIGGRLQTAFLGGVEYETGGSIIHSRNRYMLSFVKELGLSRGKAVDGDGVRSALYNGEEFVFVEHEYSFLTPLYLTARYGWDVFRLWSITNEMLNSFDKIYDLQDQGLAFHTVPELLNAISPELLNLTEYSISDFLRTKGVGKLSIDELVGATLRANYGQGTNIHGLVGLVSMAGGGDQLWSVRGGNKLVPERLLLLSRAFLIRDEVLAVELLEDEPPKFKLKLKSTGKSTDFSYDAVIVATPLTEDKSSLQFSGNLGVQKYLPKGTFRQTIANLFSGLRNKLYPYPGPSSEINTDVEMIIATDDLKKPLEWNAVSRQSSVLGFVGKGMPEVYKVFSPQPLSQEEKERLFVKVQESEIQPWLAYPLYDSRMRSTGINFVLNDRGLYYLNAIEEAASAMEMIALSARNVAILVARKHRGKRAPTEDSWNYGYARGEL